jgi:hypothetical protein
MHEQTTTCCTMHYTLGTVDSKCLAMVWKRRTSRFARNPKAATQLFLQHDPAKSILINTPKVMQALSVIMERNCNIDCDRSFASILGALTEYLLRLPSQRRLSAVKQLLLRLRLTLRAGCRVYTSTWPPSLEHLLCHQDARQSRNHVLIQDVPSTLKAIQVENAQRPHRSRTTEVRHICS